MLRLAPWASAFAIQLAAVPAAADSMDFALERLVSNPECRTAAGAAVNVGGELVQCIPDNDAFKGLINQYGMAIAPSAMYPAETTGWGGFEISLEGVYTTANSGADYMRLGTQGNVDGETGIADTENTSVASMFQLYSLRIRKGFGFGLETGLQFGYLANTSILSGGFDARIALLEGFRKGVPGYLPDIAATGSVRTITGTSQLQLTVAGVSGVISKPITIAKSGRLTPMAGYQYLWLFGDSGTIDFTPATNAQGSGQVISSDPNDPPVDLCNYQGPNQPGFPEDPAASGRDGAPVCTGSNEDFNNNAVFAPARLERQRLFFGLNYEYEILTVGAQFMFDVVPPGEAQNSADDAAVLADEPTSYSFALQIGAHF